MLISGELCYIYVYVSASITVDFGKSMTIGGIIIQGRGRNTHGCRGSYYQWVTEMIVQTNREAAKYQGKMLMPGAKKGFMRTIIFDKPIRGRYVHVRAVKWKGWPSMRFELL